MSMPQVRLAILCSHLPEAGNGTELVLFQTYNPVEESSGGQQSSLLPGDSMSAEPSL